VTTPAPAKRSAAPNAPPAELAHLPIASIIVGEQLIRSDPADEDLAELAADIAAHGLLQPIGVRQDAPGRYQLLWGYRRLQAHKRLRRDAILARICPDDGQSVRAIANRENIHRRALTLEEECEQVAYLTTDEQKSPDEIASALSKSRGWVLRRLMIPALPLDVRDALLEERISIAIAELIAPVPDETIRAQLIVLAHSQRWTAALTRDAVAQMTSSPNLAQAIEAGLNADPTTYKPSTLLLTCALCGASHPPEAFNLIRVCREGCKHEPPAT
jgi:ParB family chromosome partitioning protein